MRKVKLGKMIKQREERKTIKVKGMKEGQFHCMAGSGFWSLL